MFCHHVRFNKGGSAEKVTFFDPGPHLKRFMKFKTWHFYIDPAAIFVEGSVRIGSAALEIT